MVQAALAGDIATLLAGDHHDGLMRIVALTHTGMTTAGLPRPRGGVARLRHTPTLRQVLRECIYQPMREVLAYLRANGFKTYLVSGGGADFMRVWSERVNGVVPEQVVGSHGLVELRVARRPARPGKDPRLFFVNEKEGKPVGIHLFIGRRPVLVSATATAIMRCCSTRRSEIRGRAWRSSCTIPMPSGNLPTTRIRRARAS